MNKTAQHDPQPGTPQAISEVTSRVVDDLYSEQMVRETRAASARRLTVLALSSLAVLLAGNLTRSGQRTGLGLPPALGGQTPEEQLAQRAGQHQAWLAELDSQVDDMERDSRGSGSALLAWLAAAGFALWRNPGLRQRMVDRVRQFSGAQPTEPGIPDVPMPEAAPS